MSITFIIITLGVVGASLNTIILLGSIFKSRKSEESDSKSQQEELKQITLIIEDSKGEVIREKANVNESDADELLRDIQSYSH